jgi:penicillin-insensitive murein DD-endopeptidase
MRDRLECLRCGVLLTAACGQKATLTVRRCSQRQVLIDLHLSVSLISNILCVGLLCAVGHANADESVCYGRVADGRLAGGVQLPSDGANFGAYSRAGALVGRTYVHSTVRKIVLDAYAASAENQPDVRFVYGETGWKEGGRIKPHRTHQNGLSVDFMVPVRDKKGRPATIPRSALNKFGYELEFDASGKFEDLTIDFTAIAEHMYQLDRAAKAAGSGLALVIFDPQYLPRLFATSRGQYLRENVPFMKGKPWIRHDQHYHVDFLIKCQAM